LRAGPTLKKKKRSHGVGKFLLSKRGGEGKTKKGVPDFTL